MGYVIFGFLMLIVGGDILVRVAVRFAVRFQVPPATIGLTVVAAGTSLPELVTSVIAALQNNADIAIGNVVGSNTFNILAGIGLASLITPNRVQKVALKIDWPVLMLASVVMYALSYNLIIDRLEGSLFVIALAGFLWFSVKNAKKIGIEADEDIPQEVKSSGFKDLAMLAAGVVALIFGADLTLEGAVNIGKALGLSDRVIGLTIISAGTGLPELATSAIAAFRGRDDIAVANVMGSNIFNILGILGVTAIVQPLVVNPSMLQFDMMIMLVVSALLLPMMLKKSKHITRPEGFVLLSSYIAYVYSLL